VRRNKKTLMVAAGVAVLVFAGAAAFTASVSFSNTNTVVGYGAQTITGATVTSVTYTLSTDHTTVNNVAFVTAEDTSGAQQTAEVSFMDNSGGSPVETAWASCTVTTPYVSGTGTVWGCDVTSLTQATAHLVGIQITVQ